MDLVLAGLLIFLGVLALTVASIDRDQPGFLEAVKGRFQAREDSLRAELDRGWARAVVLYVAARRPEALPDSVRAALAAGEPGPVAGYVEAVRAAETFGIALNEQERPLLDGEGRALALDFSLVGGAMHRVLGTSFGLVAYFTLLGWAMRGRSPGKALLGLRMARLDGGPFTLWTSWSRAGGYGASLGTAGLGFLEAAWHPNRQAVHDKIAGTVVLRERRRARRTRRARQARQARQAGADGAARDAGEAAGAGVTTAAAPAPTGSGTPAR